MAGSLRDVAARLEALGANLTLSAPGQPEQRLGEHPARAHVVLHGPKPVAALLAGDHLRLAEAYLNGEVDLAGDLREVLKLTEALALDARPLERLRLGARFLLRHRLGRSGESLAAHYDRPPEFFLPWLDRWRCYSHGLYRTPDEPLDRAIERKLEQASDALGLAPGMHVLDTGGGWGCFVEYAGKRGIHVHAITLSQEQHRFVTRLIREQELPCTSQLVDFREYVPERRFDAAVFMGTLEHNPDYERVARFLARHLAPDACIWADFCAQRTDFEFGGFMKKYIWPGPTRYVNPYALTRALIRRGFNVHALVDDTQSYACTVRDWGDRFERHAKALAERFGEPTVRAFRLYLRGSQYFLERNRTQAYHLVAGREAAPLRCEPAEPSAAG